jgi:hypothetical protein
MEHALYSEEQVLLPVVIQRRFTLYWKCWTEGVGYMLALGSKVGSELLVEQNVGLFLFWSAFVYFVCCCCGL